MSKYSKTWQIEVRHPGLNKYRMISGTDQYVVQQRAAALSAQWDEEWSRRKSVDARREMRLHGTMLREQAKAEAVERSDAAAAALEALSNILFDGLERVGPFDWNALKDRARFPESKPTAIRRVPHPIAPVQTAGEFQPIIGLLEIFIPSRRAKAVAAGKARFEAAQSSWLESVAKADALNAANEASFKAELAAWEERKAEFLFQQTEQHASVDARAAAAAAGEEDAVRELLDLALAEVPYPDSINVNYVIDYSAATKSCVIDYDLPAPDDLPTLKEVRFVQAREEFAEKHISDPERARLYDSVLYQAALLTLVSAFRADANGHLERVTLNGWVNYVNRANGKSERSCVLSVAANRADLEEIDFRRVDPKECFRSLKGVSASRLIGLAPVAPLERPRLIDSRFIEAQDVASGVNAAVNLASMDWKDFEHLVRQVFEHQFCAPGSEVKVTQASRDGGVDAIVFDPDPIRGGKIIIQAKRYTNTVEVGAVRDLYGTVLNEGASKGILVTTSQFGPDARKFAQGKPLTLVDGSNLLFLLEQMGVAARINLREAKALARAEPAAV